MGWYLTDGVNYLAHPNKLISVTDVNRAYIFKDKEKANNHLLKTLKIKDAYSHYYLMRVSKFNLVNENDMNFNEIISDFNNSIQNLHSLKKYVNNKISYYDIMQSEFYHLFENGKFPAHIRSKLDKRFDECLRERRKYKVQMAKLTSLDMLLKNEGVSLETNEKIKGSNKFVPCVLVEEFKEYRKYLMES